MHQNFFVLDQLFTEQFRDEFAREIVGSWAEAASRDDQICAAQSLAHGVLNFAAGIRNRHLPRHDMAEIRESATEKLLVRIQDATQH